jgi:hypothetical protein
MNLTALHRKLLQDVLEIGNTFPLVITGVTRFRRTVWSIG